MAEAGTRLERPGDTVPQVATRLREAILNGQYRPGERLSHSKLADDLEVGRTPLREAVRMLEAEGLLVTSANRGVTVSKVGLSSVEGLYGMRLLLEPPLTGVLAQKLTDEQLEEMRAALQRMRDTSDRHSDFQTAHYDFHEVVLKLYEPETEALVERLHQRVLWHQRAYMSRPAVPANYIEVDELLVEAHARYDGVAVRRINEFHVLDQAIGLILDVDPDHRFGPLLVAAEAAGITIETNDGLIERPAGVSWETTVPKLSLPVTSNLRS